MTRRYRLKVRFDGTSFHGWQRQTAPDGEPLRTVQGELEFATARALRQPLSIVGASRTDAGVHALGQVAAFSAETSIPTERIPAAINRYLPDDVAVWDASETDDDFNPIRGAVSKTYRYTIFNGVVRPVFDRFRCHHYWNPLDALTMQDAGKLLEGEHDFTSFANANHGRESAVRIVHFCEVSRSGERIFIDIGGNGFLYHMVRIIAGTLVEVGRGALNAQAIPDIIAARDRAQAGPTLPPGGLCLHQVSYDRVLTLNDV